MIILFGKTFSKYGVGVAFLLTFVYYNPYDKNSRKNKESYNINS